MCVSGGASMRYNFATALTTVAIVVSCLLVPLADAKRVVDSVRFPAVPLDTLFQQPLRFTLLQTDRPQEASALSSIADLLTEDATATESALMPLFGPGAGVALAVANNSARVTGKTLDSRRNVANGVPVIDFTQLEGEVIRPPQVSLADEERESVPSEASRPRLTLQIMLETYYPPLHADESDEEKKERISEDRQPDTVISRTAVTARVFQEEAEGGEQRQSRRLVAAWATSTSRGDMPSLCNAVLASTHTSSSVELLSKRASAKPLSVRLRAPGAFSATGTWCRYGAAGLVGSGAADLFFSNHQEGTLKVFPAEAPASALPVGVVHIFSKRSIMDSLSLTQMLQGISAPTPQELIFDDVHTISVAPNSLDGVHQTFIQSSHGKQQVYLMHHQEASGATVATSEPTPAVKSLGILPEPVVGLVGGLMPDAQLLAAKVDGAYVLVHGFYQWSLHNWTIIVGGIAVFVTRLTVGVIQSRQEKKDMLKKGTSPSSASGTAAKSPTPLTAASKPETKKSKGKATRK